MKKQVLYINNNNSVPLKYDAPKLYVWFSNGSITFLFIKKLDSGEREGGEFGVSIRTYVDIGENASCKIFVLLLPRKKNPCLIRLK